ncbi:TonB-dependent receptor [Novosphingobium sp. Gsoil 351]|uniref:TonB-dependent receptor n=1 Tax=Novosphingobium sp. Gsoil 351 TaxID=2675225 RepID=UPI0018A858F6|nr:TonB-dependent receptor [Novosphingobium sp. Gsoil 351]
MRFLLLASSAISLALPSLAAAQEAPPAGAPDAGEDARGNAIVVTARRLDLARDAIDPSLGANVTALDREALDIQPGGADRAMKGVLLQTPGIAQDSDGDGDIHIRNEHGNVQYRLDGITVPNSFAGFGAPVDPRVAESIEVITGALPAQYGLRTAGIVSLKTRAQGFDFDGDLGLYGGGNNTLQPSFTLRDGVGRFNYFVSGSYLTNDQGISNPTASRKAIHDRTKQYRGFAYLSDVLDDHSRISAFGGTSVGDFQIPNTPGLTPTFAFNGRTTFDSAELDQNQKQQTHFGVLAYQFSGETIDFQVAPFVRYARAHYTPDPDDGQLLFNGVDTELTQASTAYGVQADSAWKGWDGHTVRFGGFWQHDKTRTDSLNRVFALDPSGSQASDVPITIPVLQRALGNTYSAYLQDEWKLSDALTINYGLRYDLFDGIVREHQWSPRASIVFHPVDGFTLHAGYARNFTPPPQELITGGTLAAFAGTTGAAPTLTADPVRAERQHSFDIGVQQVIGGRLTLGLDAYYKLARNLLDEEHFGSTLIQSPFNYDKAKGWGVEFSANYEHGPVEAYVNVARGQQKARRVVSNQFFFEPDELAYIDRHYIFTDHSQKWTASGGGALTLHDGLGKLQPSIDFIYGSGLRAADPAGIVPNGGTQKGYVQVNAGIMQVIGGGGEDKNWSVRLDVTNLFDKHYLIHDGSGVGAGQPEYGPRRAVFAGVRKSF